MKSHKILYIETYDTGSHARTLDLFQRYTRHQIHAIRVPPSHWKWTTDAAHHAISSDPYLANPSSGLRGIILSGPMNVPAVLMTLPEGLRRLPVAVYFHESQWTYPTQDSDIQTYLLGHLDAIRFSQKIWINSRFHLDTFWRSALNMGSKRLTRLARSVLHDRYADTRIVYPPVENPACWVTIPLRPTPKRILWCARWEREKRPDRFIEAMRRLTEACYAFDLALLGPGAGVREELEPSLADVKHLIAQRGPLPDRAAYEEAVRRSDIVVSTTDHEFFGIAVLEAALAGVIPVLPRAHAYPETLPSAIFYESGNIDQLVSRLRVVLDHQWDEHRPWMLDAQRFLPLQSTRKFDAAIDDLVAGSSRPNTSV